MPITLGTTIASLRAQRSLESSMRSLEQAQQRLASGLRINSAADDAAGLAMTSSLKVQARIHTQALRNISDGLSLTAIAQDGLAALRAITLRQLELAEQAANGTYSLAQRQVLTAEANTLVDEYNRIVSSVSFNGINLSGGTDSTEVAIQAGGDSRSIIQMSFGEELARSTGTGAFTYGGEYASSARGVATADFNGDGIIDLLGGPSANFGWIRLGNGNGTFGAESSFQTGNALGGSANQPAIGDLNEDGKLDLLISNGADNTVSVILGNGNGTFRAQLTIATGGAVRDYDLQDFNNDGHLDIGLISYTSGQLITYLGTGLGTFNSGSTASIGNTAGGVDFADYDHDGTIDAAFINQDNSDLHILKGNGSGGFRRSS